MPREGYYSVVDVEVGVEAGDGQGSAIGKLTAAQIEKGMAVLVQLKALLESEESSLAVRPIPPVAKASYNTSLRPHTLVA